MVFNSHRNNLSSPGLSPPTQRTGFSTLHSSSNVQNIIREPVVNPKFERQVITWRLPALGFIKMFINPQSIEIREGKDISTTRTKAGFIVQYAGEKLTEITISGVTGSAGQEGINILRAIYRSEQFAFESIADELDRTALQTQVTQLSKGLVDQGASALKTAGAAITPFLVDEVNEIALSVLSQPFPTLASLAANVEMFYQGVTYRGYFTAFNVSETAEQTGNLSYTLNFTSYARQGERRNFMPWHRQPYNPVGADKSPDVNPLSFQPVPEFNSNRQEQLPNSSETDRIDISIGVNKNFGFTVGINGRSLGNSNLEDEA